MGRIAVINHVTLDGVMQGPGRADEDTRGGFEYGGWASDGNDDVMGAKVGEWMGGEHAFLFGRRSYADMLAAWNRMGGPYQESLNDTPKYVASRHPATKLEWPNSTLLHGDVPAAVAELRETRNLVIMGSADLIGTLAAADLIDVYFLMIHPLVLGTGRRLFADGGYAKLRLTDSVTTTKGVLLTAYEPAREIRLPGSGGRASRG